MGITGRTTNENPSDEWCTPQDLWDKLNSQYHFTCDAAATDVNTKITYEYWTKDCSFLDYVWNTIEPATIWCNPPFTSAGKFIEKLDKISIGNVSSVAIYRADNMETKTWRHIFDSASWIFIFSKRIQYSIDGGEIGCPFGSALIGYNCNPPKGLEGVLLKDWDRIDADK